MLTVKLNGKILQEIKLRKEPGDKTITVRIPAAGMESGAAAGEHVSLFYVYYNSQRNDIGQGPILGKKRKNMTQA